MATLTTLTHLTDQQRATDKKLDQILEKLTALSEKVDKLQAPIKITKSDPAAPNKGARWTEEDRAKLRQYFADYGTEFATIGKKFGRTPTSIRLQLAGMGLVGEFTVGLDPLTSAQCDQIVEKFNNGSEIDTLAREYGRTNRTVEDVLLERGVVQVEKNDLPNILP